MLERIKNLLTPESTTSVERDLAEIETSEDLIRQGRTTIHACKVVLLGTCRAIELLWADPESREAESLLSTLSGELFAIHEEIGEIRNRREAALIEWGRDNPVRPGARFNEPPLIPTITTKLDPAPVLEDSEVA